MKVEQQNRGLDIDWITSEYVPHQKEPCKHLNHDRFCGFQSGNDQVLEKYSKQL